MKGITEMTEQEILALTEEDVQKLIKLRMMEEGIKIMDKPEVPELFEIEPADLKVFTIPFFEGCFYRHGRSECGSRSIT